MDVFQAPNLQLRPSQPKGLLMLSYAADADRQRMLYKQQEELRRNAVSFQQAACQLNQQDVLAASYVLLGFKAATKPTNTNTSRPSPATPFDSRIHTLSSFGMHTRLSN